MRISDWSSDVCSSDLSEADRADHQQQRDTEAAGVGHCLALQTAFGLPVEPARAEERIAGQQPKAGQQAEGREPFPPAARIGAAFDGNPLEKRAEGENRKSTRLNSSH